MVFIYVLKLNDDKYYVGKTNDLRSRVTQHFDGNGSYWTKKYKPLDMIEIIKDVDDFAEDATVLRYMSKYGIDNVRGGSFSQEINYDIVLTLIRGATGKCFKCGSDQHFVKTCDERTFAPIEFKETASTELEKCCWRKYGHWTKECVIGRSISNKDVKPKM